jgi:excinuclease ABC subunit C
MENLPTSPGVYLKDDKGKTIYVGKALAARTGSHYFQESRPFDVKTEKLISETADLEYIVTDNEVEALILESTLVKKTQPRYNVNLKDDKSYPHLKLTINEPFPKAVITRRIQKDGALYFGPFLPASLARKTPKLVNKYFVAYL